MATIDVLDADGDVVAIEKPNGNGRVAAANSRPVVLSTEDKTALDAITTAVQSANLMATSDLTMVNVTRATSGETSAVGATSGQTTRVHIVTISTDAAVTVELLDGSAGTSLRKWFFPDKGMFYSGYISRPLAKTTANTALYVKTNATANVDVTIDYVKSA